MVSSISACLSTSHLTHISGTDSLPSPNTTLKVITIGRGTQNYTCASSNSSAPKSTGAVATIFNLQDLLPIIPPLEGQAVLNILSPLLLSMPRAALDGSIIPKAGYHYFDASGSPVFDLSSSGNGVIVGSKVADITAPDATAAQGPNGAVDWLTLDAKDGSQGLSRVYRTQTASGKPPATCDGKEGEFAVEYAALYYFLG